MNSEKKEYRRVFFIIKQKTSFLLDSTDIELTDDLFDYGNAFNEQSDF